ncbi:MAG: hypothetical protein H7A47_05955 [Verrucomicrobiales bacterium]|nr:hypothetical protein [Verrucomicrobiales bacterium]
MNVVLRMMILSLGCAVAAVMASASEMPGYIWFDTHYPADQVDAPIYRPDGSGAGDGYVAQLFLVTSGGSLDPISGLRGFLTLSPEATPYIRATTVAVWGYGTLDDVTVRVRAWEASADSYEASMIRGESNDITVRLRANDFVPLVGLEGFTMHVVPEPSAATLGLLGLAFVWLARKGPPHRRERETTGPGMRSAEECRRARD